MAAKEVNTKILLNYLSECDRRNFMIFKNEKDKNKQRAQVVKLVERVRNAVSSNLVDVPLMRECILQKHWTLEILGWLSKAGVVDLVEYLSLKDLNEISARSFAEDLVFSLSAQYNLKSIFEAICMYLKDEQASDRCLITCFAVLYYEQLRNTEHLANQDSFLKIVSEFPKDAGIFHILAKIATQAFLDNGYLVTKALADAKLYKPSESEAMETLMQTVSSYAEPTDVCGFLTDFLLNCTSDTKVNWQNISLLVCCVTQKDGYSKLRGVVQELIDDALGTSDKWQIIAVLMLGRICCLPESGLKMTYLVWFSSTFASDSNRPLNSDKRAKFFLTCLTDLIDYEQPRFLKIYLHKVPCVPSTSQSHLSEYVQLVKTRLEFLNESTEVGLFATETPKNDVQFLVDSFEKSGKIPQSFFGAIMLRKRYFDREFLPKLLAACSGKETSHHALIKKLAQLGKITNDAFKKHIEHCP